MEFEGKIVLITGAVGGIGSAIAQNFYEEGVLLALVDFKEKYSVNVFETFLMIQNVLPIMQKLKIE